MLLSDVSIRRPVVCLVASIVITLIGVLSFNKLPVREYPNVDSPVISVETSYPGASAEVVESKITEPLEKELSSIDGIRVLRSSSAEQRSAISLEFNLNRDISDAANDVRDRVSRARNRLPEEAQETQVSKTDADASPIVTVSFTSDRYSRLELYDVADRLAVQRFQTVPGVGTINVRGPRYAMRLWVDSDRLAAYSLTVADIERALRQQNVDIPGGRIESSSREFTVRVQGSMAEVSDFENLVLASRDGYQVKFSDVGRVELGANDYRNWSFFKGKPAVSVQVQRQSQSNLLDVANGVKALLPVIRNELPAGVEMNVSYDTSIFVDRSVHEVYQTLAEAAVLVILTIFLFLRDWRATFIPLLAIPVSIIGTFAVMRMLGFTVNVLTLLALVLAVGLVVDDAIVVLENIYRRIEEGEGAIHAALFGSRQVAFAVIATTLTLAAVFVPVAFQSGQTGRLFFEFGLTLAVSVLVSAFVALTLTPMLCSRMLRAQKVDGHIKHGWLYEKTEPFFAWMNRGYNRLLSWSLRQKTLVVLSAVALGAVGPWLYTKLQRELTPTEDRGVFMSQFVPPVGSTPDFAVGYSAQMEQMILQIPEIERTFHRAGDGRSFIFTTLKPWEERTRKTQDIIAELRTKFQREITGGQAFPSPVRPLGQRGGSTGISMVLQGSDFNQLQKLGSQMLDEMRKSGLFFQPRLDPSPSKPQLDVRIDRARAADLKVPVSDIAATLETLLGGKRVTQFQRGNQQYDVLVQVEDAKRVTPADLSRLYVKSQEGYLIQLSNLVNYREGVVPESYPHFNRLRSITVSGQLAQDKTIGDGVEFLTAKAKQVLPVGYTYAWDGETRDFVESANDTYMLFGLALIFTFLILAAQFESWVHPVTIFTGVVLAVSGGLVTLYCTRYWGIAMTDNLYSRFGSIMLIGLVAKNGILIVEFANQLQLEGRNAFDAAFEASALRFRPILMTAICTVLGAVPIAFATGAGAETRNPLGIVVVGGLSIATFLTLFVVPVVYVLVDKACVKLTGKSSAHGLKKAQEIERQAEQAQAAGAAAQ
ncbi:MAG TPA: efflux RND transporter permease subunit [Candidatus Didemnitutus sp.]|nr:efflux RND transporter permease subunit [Candidatus Didemnitutus sp.]